MFGDFFVLPTPPSNPGDMTALCRTGCEGSHRRPLSGILFCFVAAGLVTKDKFLEILACWYTENPYYLHALITIQTNSNPRTCVGIILAATQSTSVGSQEPPTCVASRVMSKGIATVVIHPRALRHCVKRPIRLRMNIFQS
jgi:hypothetical protein